ncbi:MAG: hypothetical protein ISQ28_06135 [Alphaproteobacteria bacterium]|nr:hypothetical protein [Alphaproteobacteria bacterium]
MQLPTPQQNTAQGTERQQRRTRATAGGASAAILAAAGASTLLPAAAQAQDGAFTPSPAVADAEAAQTAPVAEMAAESVLLSSLAAQAAPTMAPGSIAPLAAPGAVPGVVPGAIPAVSLLGETSELAQTVTATAPVAAEESYESFWPEGHWGDSGSSGWAGIIGTSLSLTGTVAGVGGTYLLWRSLNQAPTFEYPIVHETFTEQPCDKAVYTAPGKDANNQDEDLTYSIVASEFDDSDLVEIDNDGKVTFKQDPLFDSPGDRDRDGVYSFTVQVEDPRGETAEQAVFLTIERKSGFLAIDTTADPLLFTQHGGSVCADHFQIDGMSDSPSLFDISGGSGNDLADIDGDTVTDIGIRLGAGADTLFVRSVNATTTTVEDVLVDLGDGRDTIELDRDVSSLIVQNFDADDLLILDGGRLTASVGLDVALYDGTSSKVFTSELEAEKALDGSDEVVSYQNGQDSYLLIQDGTDISTTVKFEDTILTDYSQIIV